MATSWHIQLFGAFKVVGTDNSTIDRFRTSRSTLLLAYLALSPGKAHSRDVLCEMLWPEEDPVQQRNRLRYELTVLRNALGKNIFQTPSIHEVALCPEITSDVTRFESALAMASRARAIEERLPHLEQAFALYRGEFLPGRYLPEGCPPEQDWISLTRDRLQQQFSRGVGSLLTDFESLGRWEEVQQIRVESQQRYPDILLPDPSPQLLRSSLTVAVSENAFIGRESEKRFLADWIAVSLVPYNRLLTITGTGGIGKTRLVQEVMQGKNAVFIPLAGKEDSDQIWEALHQSFGLPRRPGLKLEDQAIATIRSQEGCLLVLDNLEHLLPTLGLEIERILTQCPTVRVIATSRRPIGSNSEQILPLNPLSPEEGATLLLSRARVIRPDFARTPQGQVTARATARLLEGMPLALEIAAARTTVLSPTQLLEQLSHRLRFLVRSRFAESNHRHSSVRATVSWSFDLLSAESRIALTRLSVFRGSFSFAAGLSVCGDDLSLVDALEELCAHSLVHVRTPLDIEQSNIQPYTESGEHDSEETRYDLLAVIQEYAAERLSDTERKIVERRHAGYFRQHGAAIDKAARHWRWQFLQQHFIPDIQNYRAALTFATRSGDAELVWGVLEATVIPFFELGYWDEVNGLLTNTEAIASTDAKRMERYLGLCGALARRRGAEGIACQFWERRLSLLQEHFDTVFADATPSIPSESQSLAADSLVDVLLDLAGQSVDRWEWERAAALLKDVEGIMERVPVPNREIPRWSLTARVRHAAGDREATQEALKRAEVHTRTLDSQGLLLYFSLHALPILRDWRDWATSQRLLWQSLQTAFIHSQPFILGRCLTELGQMIETVRISGTPADLPPEVPADAETMLMAYYCAYQIHNDLGTRMAENSRLDWERTRRVYPALADSLMLTGQSWEEVADKVRSRLLRSKLL